MMVNIRTDAVIFIAQYSNAESKSERVNPVM